MSRSRSNRPDVRNPILRMPQLHAIKKLPVDTRRSLCNLLDAMAADARELAEKSWRKHKAPMAVYWKGVAVYAKHISRAVRS